MKTLLSAAFTLLITTGMFFSACTPKPKGPQLPPATQEGKNTIGALINGTVYSTYDEPRNQLVCYNTCKFYEGTLGGDQISSGMCGSNGYDHLYLYIYDTLVEGRTYNLGGINPQGNAKCHSIIYPEDYYNTDTANIGTLTVTKLTWNIISGTFQFKAKGHYNPQNSITVTQGRFDLKRN